jgi:hypothetical protein
VQPAADFKVRAFVHSFVFIYKLSAREAARPEVLITVPYSEWNYVIRQGTGVFQPLFMHHALLDTCETYQLELLSLILNFILSRDTTPVENCLEVDFINDDS